MIKTWLPTESASTAQEITRGHNAKAVSADGLYGDLQQVTVVRYKEVSPSGHSSGEKGVIKGIGLRRRSRGGRTNVTVLRVLRRRVNPCRCAVEAPSLANTPRYSD